MEDNLEKELEQAQEIYALVVEFFVNYSFQILGALLILMFGMYVAKKISNVIYELCQKKHLDITLSRFIASVAKIIIIVMVAVIALGKIGVSVTPFLAAIGALSLGAGLAVQGLLSNYGAGLNIILTRPFVVGDTINVQGVSGQVKEVQLAFTILTNEDGTQITIPNRHIVGEIIHNSFEFTLAELSIGIAYSEDPDNAIHLIETSLTGLEGVTDDKRPQVGIESFGDSSVNLGIRLWLPTQQYFTLLYEANRRIYAALKDNQVVIPFPQQEVRLLNEVPPAASHQ
ncbi:mechanosensitive ion channel [Aestuariicella hydrocarbonica]|uniref:Small-conductance mechanosensitive channel n=1 Tax=Pseudomaricurvus hydrocarbonicus TaxID=1470433 RepID=A0A9E5JRG6_9GAMM|nr:mechanosensitive ion channel domain-containing protein [Aestuariicella hydrocarbonica]NHO65412.1 mechanosensitive ion channel [Aestuariicella hydrocarbonica]